jgi:molecular chaperone HtpG
LGLLDKKISFKAEVNNVLQIVVNSLYSNKEIFLRELISNSSDAIQKVKFEMLLDSEVSVPEEFNIYITIDKENGSLVISDNGLGMNEEDIITNLGSIAKSGTRDFIAKLSSKDKEESGFIGSFGVGFYSCFIVSKKVIVKSRKFSCSKSEAVEWSSSGDGFFNVKNIEKTNVGTEITLFLKDDDLDFLNNWKVKSIINKYSNNIPIPIYMEKVSNKKVTDSSNEKEEIHYDRVNSPNSLWLQHKTVLKNSDYVEFYKDFFKDYNDPLFWVHNKLEGNIQFNSLLFIPGDVPHNFWSLPSNKGLKLYIKRVFIMDNVSKFLPNYLRFIRGVIDCEDLPLNISREILQDNKLVLNIRSILVKKVLNGLTRLLKEDYNKYLIFWNYFGKVLKEGPVEDKENSILISNLFRFSSTLTGKKDNSVSFSDYISRNGESTSIFYIAGDSFDQVYNNPNLEFFVNKGIEVLLLYDKIDEWLMLHLQKFKDFKLVSILKLDDDYFSKFRSDDSTPISDDKLVIEEEKDLLNRVKETLSGKVKDVRFSNRLVNFPSSFIIDEYDTSLNMQRIMKSAGQPFSNTQPILEINGTHKIFNLLVNSQENEDEFNKLSLILYEQAILSDGGQLNEPSKFLERINSILK